MPDITQKASLEYWKNYPDPMIFRVIAYMETVEKWVHDGHPDLEKAITRLANALEDITKFELKNQDDYIKLGNHIHIGRILRIMQAIDTTHPGSASKLLMHAEQNTQSDNDPCGLFLRRNIVFERLRLLARVFAAERLAIIQKAIEKDEEDED